VTRRLVELAGPLGLVFGTAAVASGVSTAHQLEFQTALIMVAIVVGLYSFVGNSGVISFGHMSFVAAGAYLAGIVTVDTETKGFTMPGLFSVLHDAHTSVVVSLVLATAIGAVYALVVGLPLMRLSGLPAGIATLAVLGITYNVLSYWGKIGPGVQTVTGVPESGVWALALGVAIVVVAAYVYQRSRNGRMLRATREDPAAARASGISVYRERLISFVLSGALCGLAGGLYVHMIGLIQPDLFYLDLTLVTLAMLVFGGVGSLLGAVVGALAISALNSFLGDAENSVDIGFHLTLPNGTRLVTLGAVMALVLILRPEGLVGGREFGWRR
jgi:branched-chain amino acid transport system permease protein